MRGRHGYRPRRGRVLHGVYAAGAALLLRSGQILSGPRCGPWVRETYSARDVSRTSAISGSAPLDAADWAFLKARWVGAFCAASAADVHRHAAAGHREIVHVSPPLRIGRVVIVRTKVFPREGGIGGPSYEGEEPIARLKPRTSAPTTPAISSRAIPARRRPSRRKGNMIANTTHSATKSMTSSRTPMSANFRQVMRRAKEDQRQSDRGALVN